MVVESNQPLRAVVGSRLGKWRGGKLDRSAIQSCHRVEAKRELDRFCDAMIGIRQEIEAIAQGAADRADNLLRNAPHTADLLVGEWSRPYARQDAFFPVRGLREAKYWPPVGRVDNAYGDRHLVCTCTPAEAYQDAAD